VATGSADRTSTIGRCANVCFNSPTVPSAAEPAQMHDRHTVAPFGLVEIVRRHEHGSAGSRQVVDETPELPARDRIHAAGGLIEKNDWRFVQECTAQSQPLTPSAAEIAGSLSLAAREARDFQHELPASLEAFAGNPVHPGPETDVLIDRQQFVEREPLRHVADAALDGLGIRANVDPSINALPEVGFSSPQSIRIVVDFPAPLLPRNPKTSPRVTSNDTLSTALKAPKVRLIEST
jgi:hypothetical protein